MGVVSSIAPVTSSSDPPSIPPERADILSRIAHFEELAAFLSDLATSRPDHIEMLYRLADKAAAEAARLRSQIAI